MRDTDLPAPTGRDARRNPHVDQGVAKPVGIVTPVPEQGGGLWDRGEQSPCADIVRRLARRQKHPDRATFRVGHDVQFRVQSTLRAPDQPSAPPF